MIKVVAKNYFKEGAREDALVLLKELIAKTKEEKGNIAYDLFEPLDDPNTLVIFEDWEDEESLKAHMGSEHFQRLLPQLGQYKAEGTDGSIEIFKSAD